jgi:hypothetical protein
MEIGRGRTQWLGNPFVDDEMQFNKWSIHNSIAHFNCNKILKNVLNSKHIRRCELIFLYNTVKSIEEFNEFTMILPHISDDPESGLHFDSDLQIELISQQEKIILEKANWKEHMITPLPKNWVSKNNMTYYSMNMLEKAEPWLKIKHLQTDNIRNIFEVASSFEELDVLKEIIVKDHKYKEDKLKMYYNRRKKQLDSELNVGKAGSNKGNVRL